MAVCDQKLVCSAAAAAEATVSAGGCDPAGGVSTCQMARNMMMRSTHKSSVLRACLVRAAGAGAGSGSG